MEAHEALEHSEHISHAGHGHGHAEADGKQSRLPIYVGITMAVLGVLLAFCSAKVGGERTELVQTLVQQQNAHAKYQGQDIKHRVAFLDLQALHAGAGENGASLDKKDLLEMVGAVDRYFNEAAAAKEWLEAYEPAIELHVEAQEHYETAQLFAEIGIVIASIALLTRKRPAWYAALALGTLAIGTLAVTYAHASRGAVVAERAIEERGKEYRDLRNADKTTAQERVLLDEVRHWAGAPPAAPAAHGEPKHEGSGHE